MTRQVVLLALCLWLSVPASLLYAHGLHGQATVQGDKILVEAFFDDDTRPEGAKVRLHDAADRIVAHGLTDRQGICILTKPAPGEYRLVIDAGAGHRYTENVSLPGQADPSSMDLTPRIDRQNMTRTLWLRAGIGVAVIAVLAALAWLALRRRPIT